MSRLTCLYGTVLNSAATVDESIKSAFRPEYERIVIVDGGSIDGTYEKLMELRKDFNLEVYRLPGASRGKGRDYALRRCPEGSYAAYFDLDDRLTEWYHRALEWGISSGEPNPFLWLHLRDYAIARGGWRDLNFSEDMEFGVRVGFNHSVPLQLAVPVKANVKVIRELRYASGTLRRLRRLIIMQEDLVRGTGSGLKQYVVHGRTVSLYRSYGIVRAYIGVLIYALAYLKGIYRYDERLNNDQLVLRRSLEALLDPTRELGASPQDVFFVAKLSDAEALGLATVVRGLLDRLPWAKVFLCAGGQLALAESESSLRRIAELRGGPLLNDVSARRCVVVELGRAT